MGRNTQTIAPPSKIVSSLYQAAAEPARWPDVISRVTDWLGGSQGILQARTLNPSVRAKVIWPGVPDRYFQAYTNHHCARDPHLRHLARLPVGRALLSREVLSDRELYSTEYFNEFCRPQHLGDLQGVVLLRTSEWGVTYATFGSSDRRFERADQARLDALVPDLTRALSLAFRWDGETPDHALDMAAGINLLAFLHIDHDLRALQAPDAACARVLTAESATLTYARSHLRARTPRDHETLRRAVRAAAQGHGTVIHLGPPESRLRIGVAPGPRMSPLENERCVTLVFAPISRDSAELMRRRITTLPNALRPVAECLMEGMADKEISERLGLPLPTARTYVTRTLARLDVQNRRQLMR